MSLGDHLDELRRRIIHTLIGIGIALMVTMFYGREIVSWVCRPLTEAQRVAGMPRYLIGHSVTAPLTIYLMVSLVAAAVLVSPWIAYQFWLFISKGLYPSERRGIYLFTPLSTLMTVLGVLFTYYLFMPAALAFLIAFTISYPPPEKEGPGFLRTMSELMANSNDGSFMPMVLPWNHKPATQPEAPPMPEENSRLMVVDHDPEKPVEGEFWFNRTENQFRIFAGGRVSIVQISPVSLIAQQLEIGQYLWFFSITLALVVGAFQIPVVMLLLSTSGLIDPKTVAAYRKVIVYVLISACILIAPSQDLFTNVVLPLVLWGLFEMGLILMKLTWKGDKTDHDSSLDEMEESR